MMKKIKSLLFTFVAVLCTLMVRAQGGESGLGETMRSNGRIYVVVGVILIILGGLILYVYRLDKKITRLEKDKH